MIHNPHNPGVKRYQLMRPGETVWGWYTEGEITDLKKLYRVLPAKTACPGVKQRHRR